MHRTGNIHSVDFLESGQKVGLPIETCGSGAFDWSNTAKAGLMACCGVRPRDGMQIVAIA